MAVKAVIINGAKSKITADQLATSWNTGLDTAKRTLQAATQVGLCNVFSPGERKVRLKAPWLKFPSVNTRTFSDVLSGELPSIHEDAGAVLFTDGKGFDSFFPLNPMLMVPST